MNIKLMTDDATINDRAGHTHYYAEMAVARGCLVVASRCVRESIRVITTWIAASKTNGRQAGWLLQTNTGFGVLHDLLGTF